MEYSQFFDNIKNGQISRVYFFAGEESFVMQKALSGLREKLLTPGLEDLNEVRLEAPRSGALIAACETLPIMSPVRFVTVWDMPLLTAGKSRDEAQESAAVCDYLDTLPDTVCLVFICPSPDTRKKVPQKLAKLNATVTFNALSEPELAAWIRNQIKTYGKTMEPRAISALIRRVGNGLSTINAELLKLRDYTLERADITESDVEYICTASAEYNIFEMTDALVRKQPAKAMEILKKQLDAGESRIAVIALITRQFRLMALASAPSPNTLKALGVSPYVLSRVQSQARGFDAQWLKEAYLRCVETDYSIKSGRMREDAALDRLMIYLGLGL